MTDISRKRLFLGLMCALFAFPLVQIPMFEVTRLSFMIVYPVTVLLGFVAAVWAARSGSRWSAVAFALIGLGAMHFWVILITIFGGP